MGMYQHIANTTSRGLVGVSAPATANVYGFDSW